MIKKKKITVNQNKRNFLKIRKEKIKLPLFADEMIKYIEKYNRSTVKH